MDLWLCPRERVQGKETSPQQTNIVKTQLQSRMASGPQSWAPEPEDKPHPTEGGAKQLPLKDRKKKNWWVSRTTELLLKPIPGLDAQRVTPELLRLNFFCSWAWNYFLCVCLFCSLFVCYHLSLLISFILSVFFFLSFISFLVLLVYCCKLANTILHTDQG
jgi:hypothetical protein